MKREDFIKSSSGWKYIAYDESNHGRYPEYCVCFFSYLKKDSFTYRSPHFGKIRANHRELENRITKRDYRFLLLEEKDASNIKELKKPALIFGSLIYDVWINEEPLFLYDGDIRRASIEYAKDLISDIKDIPKSAIKIKNGADYDKKNFLVNLADEMAHALYKKKSERLNRIDKEVLLKMSLLPLIRAKY
jgi:hypothetical protein